MAPLVNDFKSLHTLYFGGVGVTLSSGLLAPGGNTPGAILLAQCFGSPRAEIATLRGKLMTS